MLLEMRVPKGKKSQPDEPAPAPAAPEPPVEAADDEYTEPVKVPLWFKQGLERIAQRANQERKRRDKSARKLPLGHFVVQQLGEWVRQTAAEIPPE